jgi:uncharacterized protein (DUF433 family)
MQEIAPSVWIDPGIRSGEPCVAGTALSTKKVMAAFQRRRSIRAISKDHRISEAMVEDVIRYEMSKATGEGLAVSGMDSEDAFRQIDHMMEKWDQDATVKAA